MVTDKKRDRNYVDTEIHSKCNEFSTAQNIEKRQGLDVGIKGDNRTLGNGKQ